MTALTQSYVHGASDKPLIGETIGALLDRVAAEAPDSPALVVRHQAVRWSYRELRVLDLQKDSNWLQDDSQWQSTDFRH